jgi:hypothetical protein
MLHGRKYASIVSQTILISLLDYVTPIVYFELSTYCDRNLFNFSRLTQVRFQWLTSSLLMQQKLYSPKQDYRNRRAISSLADTLSTVVEPVLSSILSTMPLLQQ